MSNRIAMLLDHNGAYDSRVIREARSLKAAGYDVRIFCKTATPAPKGSRPDDVTYIDCPFDNYNTLSRLMSAKGPQSPIPIPVPANTKTSSTDSDTKPSRNVFKRVLGTALSFHVNMKTVRQAVLDYAPDILHAHDLSMLPAGTTLAKRLNIPLIYDSHEYEYDRNIVENRLQSSIRRHIERRNIPKSDAVITVSDSIADALTARNRIPRPHIVLNSSPLTNTETSTITRSDMNLPAGPMGVYFGSIQQGRGLQQAIEALTHLPDSLCIIGRTNTEQQAKLMRYAASLGISEKVYFRPALPPETLLLLGGVFDYSIIPIQKSCASYDFALPNKLFQSAGAKLPLIVTPLKEISRFTECFKLGCVAKGFTGNYIAKAIQDLAEKPQRELNADALYPYSWKASEDILLAIYEALLKDKALPISRALPHNTGD